MWAGILALLAAFPAIAEILNLLAGFVKSFQKTATEQIEDDKAKLKEEIRKSDESGRP